jgi:hypothetical protein
MKLSKLLEIINKVKDPEGVEVKVLSIRPTLIPAELVYFDKKSNQVIIETN